MNMIMEYLEDLIFFGPNADVDFITDAFPSRESYSIYLQTTYSLSDNSRFVSGLRYSEDTFKTDVANFFNAGDQFKEEGTIDKITGKAVYELDLNDASMTYVSYTKGYKPGGNKFNFWF